MAAKHKFKTMRNGYNTYEVDDVIEKLENDLQEVRNQVENYRRLSEQANDQLLIVKERYAKLVGQIEVREKAADDISRLALKEANRIIETAQSNADNIVLEATTTARIILSEINKLSIEANDAKIDLQEKINELNELLVNVKIPEVIEEDWLKN